MVGSIRLALEKAKSSHVMNRSVKLGLDLGRELLIITGVWFFLTSILTSTGSESNRQNDLLWKLYAVLLSKSVRDLKKKKKKDFKMSSFSTSTPQSTRTNKGQPFAWDEVIRVVFQSLAWCVSVLKTTCFKYSSTDNSLFKSSLFSIEVHSHCSRHFKCIQINSKIVHK